MRNEKQHKNVFIALQVVSSDESYKELQTTTTATTANIDLKMIYTFIKTITIKTFKSYNPIHQTSGRRMKFAQRIVRTLIISIWTSISFWNARTFWSKTFCESNLTSEFEQVVGTQSPMRCGVCRSLSLLDLILILLML